MLVVFVEGVGIKLNIIHCLDAVIDCILLQVNNQ